MIHRIILSILIIFILTFTVFASDDVWDISQDEVDKLYEEGLISDEAYEALQSDNASDYAYVIPTEVSSFDGSIRSDNSSNSVSLEEQTAIEKVDDLSGAPSILMASVPTSGGSYSDPVLIGVDYAPDPPTGSLLEVIYNLIGKPVSAYHYSYQSNNQGYTQYSCDIIDYDLNWIASLALLALVIFSILKAGGALICKQ